MNNSALRDKAFELISRINKTTYSTSAAQLKSLQAEVFEFVRVPRNTQSITVLELRILKQFLRRRPPQQPISAAQQLARQLEAQANRGPKLPQRPAHPRPGPADKRDARLKPLTPEPRQQTKARTPAPNGVRTVDSPTNAPSPKQFEPTDPDYSNRRSNSIPTPNQLAKLAKKPRTEPRPPTTSNRPESNRQTDLTSQIQESDHGNYRTILRFTPKEAGKLRQIISNWLDEKSIPLPFGTTQAHQDSANKLFAETIKTERMTARFDELRIVENTEGYFSTRIILATSPTDCYLEVDIVSPDGIFAQPPRFIRRVANFGSVDGAPNGWHAGPVEIDVEELSSLVDYVNSPKRSLPVFVIGTTFDPTLQRTINDAKRQWAKFLPGNAALAVLTPAATRMAADAFGNALAPSPWSIRTYVPGLDKDAPFEGRRHRILGQARLLEDNPTHTASRLGRISKRERALATAPEQLRQAHKSLAEARNRILVKGEFYLDRIRSESQRIKAVAPVTSTEAVQVLNDEEIQNASLLKQLIDANMLTDDLTIKLAEAYEARQNTDVEARLNELTERLAVTTDERDSEAEDNRVLYSLIDELEDDLEKLSQQNSLLAVAARTSNNGASGEEAYSEVTALNDLLDEIDSFNNLVDAFPDFEDFGISLTCDPKEVAQLDDIDTNGRAIAQTLRALRTLIDYLRAKRDEQFEGSMHSYLTNAPNGYFKVSQKMHASRESESTMTQYGHLRQLPVPQSISQNGYAEMQAHFKLEKIGIKSPRLHYFDASASSQRVVVGYIGPHLQTDGTN